MSNHAASARSTPHTALQRKGVPPSFGENRAKPPSRRTVASGQKLDKSRVAALVRRARHRIFPAQNEEGRPEYPVDSLGPLADVCKALRDEGQVPVEIAGQCLLATASLLAQSEANVETLAGVKPLSLFCLTIAESGEGKSTAEDVALLEIADQQKEATKRYKHLLTDRRRKKPELPDDSPPPREPYRLVRDGTVEGLRRSFKEGLPSQGLFTAEAAVMLGGYGMSAEQRTKTAANLNSFWDSGEISIARGMDGRFQLYDRRLAIDWLVQPEAAHRAVNDPMLAAIGFWPRFLLACPAPTGPLKARLFRPKDSRVFQEYWAGCRRFLTRGLGEDCADLPTIHADEAALDLARRFYEQMQWQAKADGGELRAIKPFAVRAPEQAFRIAGVLSIFQGRQEIDEEAMKGGISLAYFSLASWNYLFEGKEGDEQREWALRLYEWLLKQPGGKSGKSDILKKGPKPRSKARRDDALGILKEARLVREYGKQVQAILLEETP